MTVQESTTDLLKRLRSLDVSIRLETGRLQVRAPQNVLTPDIREELAARKPEILAFLTDSPESDVGTDAFDLQPLKRIPREKALSFGQQRLWYLDQLEPGSTVYNVSVCQRLEGRLDRGALERSLREIIRRHESLRTAIRVVDGVPETHPMPCGDWKLSYLDLRPRADDASSNNNEDSQSAVSTILDSELHKPFDLVAGNLIRATLIRTADLESTLILVIHHIAVDGWSLGVMGGELAVLYSAFRTGRPSQLPELPMQYSDYSAWQREWLESGVLAAELPYWKEHLQGATQVQLPSDRPRPPISTFRGKRFRHRLSGELVAAVRGLARTEEATLYMALLSTFYILLHRYTGQTDLTVGGAVAGRYRPEFENLIGVLINSLPFRTSLADDPTVRELLGRVKETTLGGLSHQHVPFDQLVAALQPPRDLNRAPFFELMFNLQNVPKRPFDLPDLEIHPVEIDQGTSRFDLTVEAYETEGSIQLDLEYSTDLYDEATIRKYAVHFERLLTEMTLDPDQRISALRMLSDAEISGISSIGEGRSLDYRQDRVGDWIETQCAATPNAIAVVCEGRQLAYRELSSRSNRLARRLVELGVTRGSLVGVCLDRSEEMIVAVLAIWKAGAAYVPLDPQFPADRLNFMAEDSAISLLVTEEKQRGTLRLGLGVRTLVIDSESAHTSEQDSQAISSGSAAGDLAYVLYTSGSTGKPKGVQITHRALTNFLASMLQEPGLTAGDCLLSVTTLSFDIAGLEMYLPLVAGARMVIATREAASDGGRLARLIAGSGATVMQATPATWRLLLEAGWTGQAGLKIICGGEALPQDLAKRLLATGAELWNAYGPTETTIWSTLQRVTSSEQAASIGRPIANTRILLLDEHRQLVPRGAIGELCIGGDGLARGYLNRAELTRERFIDHPFAAGERLYRTGDLARWLPGETIEFLGRMDQQVKIRGWRIELEEIEAVLESIPQIRQAVVVVRDFGAGDQRLVAYVSLSGTDEFEPLAIRQHLAASLPNYMVPAHLVALPSIPLTANGKVDRRALASRDDVVQQVSRFVAPRTEVERVMAGIWSEVLGVAEVGVFDNFFELGGHSLSATRLIARLRSAFQTEMPLRYLFIEPTIGGLSKHIQFDVSSKSYRFTSVTPQWNCMIPAQPQGTRTPLFLVAGYQSPDDTLLVASRLIPHLGLDQPVFGFRPRWIEGDQEMYASVEEAAREFLAEMRTVQSRGPYLLGGYCVGGVVALEIARQLMQQGEKVELLVLIETERPNGLRAFLDETRRLCGRAKHAVEVIAGIIRSPGRSRKDAIRGVVDRKLGGPPLTKSGLAADRFYENKIGYRRLIYRHKMKTYPGLIDLIVNERQYRLDRHMGWKGVAQAGLKIHAVPGDHNTILTMHGKQVAQLILKRIDEVLPPSSQTERDAEGLS
jgi:amino acid adenylation domain-containing protein